MIEIRCTDNLELMAEIESNTIDLIYCDILYGTGRKFKDYQDLKPIRSEIENHYIPRIKEMQRVLKDTGSIYLQMDTRVNHWVRCIMDDIFGYDNFKNEIIWHYKTGGATTKYFNRKHDVILFYTKSNKYLYNNIKEISIVDKTKGYNPYTERFTDKFGNDFVLTNARDVWDIQHINMHDKKNRNGYCSQKPKKLIEKIIRASSNEGDLVADFYAGSFTTAVVCKELNRNFIGCDINPKAIEIANARLDAVS